MPKAVRAFFLGLLSLFLFMFVGETAGLFPAFILMVAYFSICQFLLSRGNVDAYRKDWRVMLALDATVFVCVFIMVLVEKRDVVLSQGVGLLLSGCGGTYVGAVVASLTARRRAVRQVTVTVSLAFRRRSLLTSAVLLVVVALVVAAAVIPPVRADIFPRAAPQRAATAFWANVACNLLAATVLVFIAVRATGRSRLSTTILELMAFLVLLLSFLLTSAAFGFRTHGPAMHTVSVLLFICSAADLLAAALVLPAMVVFSKRARLGLTADSSGLAPLAAERSIVRRQGGHS